MNYFQMIGDTIAYIETHLDQNMTVDELASRHHISKFYFTRIFKAVTRKNVKEYIDGRRMAEAAQKLRKNSARIIDVALEYGFESHEAFTRKFKNLYGITPGEYKKSPRELPTCERIEVVERQFKNLHRDLIVDFQIESPGTIQLTGKHIRFNPDNPAELPKVKAFFNQFIARYIAAKGIDRIYNVTGGEAAPGETIDYFAGYQPQDQETHQSYRIGLTPLTLEASDYAVFRYKNTMEGIHRLVASDVWKAILLSDLTLNQIGIHFFELYERGYDQTNEFQLYVPIKS
ncbi:MAG TPA: AraC family transcriptional regulator [Bacillota bacterium]